MWSQIHLFNTNKVYQMIFIAIRDIFVNTNHIFVGFGIPNNCLRRFMLAAGAFFFEKKRKRTRFWEVTVLVFPSPVYG